MGIFVGNSYAATEFTNIELFPQNVGVFTTGARSQQFVAFGYTADGGRFNITEEVTWQVTIDGEDTNIVTISEGGLAKLEDGVLSGIVDITCVYPKTTEVNLNPAMYQLLLNAGQ